MSKPSLITVRYSSAPIGLWPLLIDPLYVDPASESTIEGFLTLWPETIANSFELHVCLGSSTDSPNLPEQLIFAFGAVQLQNHCLSLGTWAEPRSEPTSSSNLIGLRSGCTYCCKI
jgi:hypothetical protein